MKILLAIIYTSFFVTSAMAEDITGGNSNLYIKVETDQEMRRFSLCDKRQGPSSCDVLGFRGWYSVEELKSQRNTEIFQTVLSGGAVAGATVFASVGGWLIAGGVANTWLTLGASDIIANAISLGAIGATPLAAEVVGLGPIEQFRQQHILRGEVINDQRIHLENANDKKIQKLAILLRTILEKLDD